VNTYQRLFGAGPRGLLLSLIFLVLAFKLESTADLPALSGNSALRWTLISIFLAATIIMLVWSIRSLPLEKRGNKLVTGGAFRYFRHPLYAAFLLFFNFALAIFLNNWIYIFWAIILHGVWHLNITSEEKLMQQKFPGEYAEYCEVTGRFFPHLFR